MPVIAPLGTSSTVVFWMIVLLSTLILLGSIFSIIQIRLLRKEICDWSNVSAKINSLAQDDRGNISINYEYTYDNKLYSGDKIGIISLIPYVGFSVDNELFNKLEVASIENNEIEIFVSPRIPSKSLISNKPYNSIENSFYVAIVISGLMFFWFIPTFFRF